MAYDNNSYEQGSNITREVVDQSTKPLRKAGKRAGEKVGKVAAKAGAKAAKAGGKAAAEGAKGLGTAIAANPVVAIAVLVIVILLLIILLIFQQGSASSSYKQVFRDNAIGESRYYNYPSTKEEAISSIKDAQIARDDTESIVKILHEVKREDYQNISKIAKSAVKKAALKTNLFTLDDVDVEQSLQSAKKEASEMSGWSYSYIGASGNGSSGNSTSPGEDIAAMAEKLAWPKGTSKNKYQKGKGGAPTKAFKDAWDKYYGGNISVAACCCHSARTVLAATAGKKVKKTLLPQGTSAEKAKKKLEKAVNGLGYSVITWNGNMSTIKRGDICTYRKTGGKEGHVFIYLGNGLAAHGGKTNGYYLRISGMNSSSKSTTGKCWYYIIRKTEGTASSDTGATYQKQPSGTILKEITADTGRRVKIKNGSKYDVAQSIAASDDGFAVALVAKSANGPGEIRLYDSTGIYKSKYSATIYHANGATMTADNELLVTGALHSSNGRKFTYSGDSLSDGGTYKFPKTTSGIAYDKETGVYAMSEGKALITTTDMNNTKKVLSRSEHGPWYGDIAAGGGYIFACHSINKKGNNYVDIYNEETGDFCGSYKVSYGELESACLFNGELVLLVHEYGTETNYLHFTGIQVTGGSSMAEPITVLDMDILAAYNISISNSATIKEDEPEGEKGTIFKSGSSDGWADKDGYKDISNKNVELYWFGLNRGLINYEKDFKKKIDRIFKGNAVVKVDNSKKTIEKPSEEDEKDTSKHFYKVVVGNSAETVTTTDENGNTVKKKIVPMTIKEKEVDELMNPLFGVNPDEDYINSKTIKTAKQEENEKNGTALKDGETSRLLKIDGGTATNLKAAYSISDITGIMLYGRPEQIDPVIAAFPTSSSYGSGALKLPLPPSSFTITDTFQSLDPIRGGRRHDGLDLGAPTGTPIYSSLPGEVKLAKFYGGYGNCVIIESGTTKITYGHMSKILVEAGHPVQAGQVIGQVGSTGHSTGPHLHFEVSINGKLVDPKPLLGL